MFEYVCVPEPLCLPVFRSLLFPVDTLRMFAGLAASPPLPRVTEIPVKCSLLCHWDSQGDTWSWWNVSWGRNLQSGRQTGRVSLGSAQRAGLQAGTKHAAWKEAQACPHMALDLSSSCSCLAVLALASSSGLSVGGL